jgi:hypothetical protein
MSWLVHLTWKQKVFNTQHIESRANDRAYKRRTVTSIAKAQRLALPAAGAGVDSAWEQEKLEARKILKNAARRGAAVPIVQCTHCWAVVLWMSRRYRHCSQILD